MSTPARAQHHRAGVGLALAGWLAAAPSTAEPLVTSLPHTLHVGAPHGSATAAGVDPARSRHAPALPTPDAARVLWQRQLPGGIACNVLVDGDGRTFVAGQGRVSQLGPDGALQYSVAAESSSAVGAVLLPDASRAVLTREGHVSGWSPTGALVFDVALDAPPPTAQSTLLPLPEGGLLVSIGAWLFEVDVTRQVAAYASLPAPVQHTLLLEQRALAVDERGRVFEWDRPAAPHQIGAGSGPFAAVAADRGALVALSGRVIERLDAATGELHEILRLDAPGAAPLLALAAPEQSVSARPDGTWLFTSDAAPARAGVPRSSPDALTRIDLVADASGSVAWWAADVPLHVETAPGVGKELAEVRCASPVSLAPAGGSRLVAACNSGAIWLVGPDGPREP